MVKRRVADFDQAVCKGEAPGVFGPCSHLETRGGSTGRAVIDALADVEGRALEAVTGERQFKCGMCGCPLANLGATDMAPEGCPRLSRHDG